MEINEAAELHFQPLNWALIASARRTLESSAGKFAGRRLLVMMEVGRGWG